VVEQCRLWLPVAVRLTTTAILISIITIQVISYFNKKVVLSQRCPLDAQSDNAHANPNPNPNTKP